MKAHRHVNPDGSLGGLVDDTAYVAYTSWVKKSARVCDNVCVEGRSTVHNNVILRGNEIYVDYFFCMSEGSLYIKHAPDMPKFIWVDDD